MNRRPLPELECVSEPRRAGVLLSSLRLRLLGLAREPASATELAGRLRLPRQRVNYHVRQLFGAGFLRRAGRRRKRNMIEQRYVASARAYVLTPDLMGPVAAGTVEDRLSGAHLIALAARAQVETARALREASAQGKRLSTLSIESSFRFESAEQRQGFTRALQEAVAAVVSRHTSAATGRPYRLVLGCYPVPPPDKARQEE